MTGVRRLRFLTLFLPMLLLAQLPAQPPRDLAHDILKQLIEINTTDSVGNNTTAAQAIATRFRSAGVPEADIHILGPNERKGNLIVRFHGTDPARQPVLLLGHLDVVEAKRSDWTTDPFQLVEKDGFYYGRGTQDIKASDALLITTLLRFQQEHYRPNRDLILALTADEEGGRFNGVSWLLHNHRDLIQAEYVINVDAGGIYLDQGKLVDIELEATEKQYADYQFTVRNAGGHSSQPVPDNAIYRLSEAMTRLGRTPFPFELNPVTRAYFTQLMPAESAQNAADMRGILQPTPDEAAIRRLSAQPQFNSVLRTTCVATRLEAGHANNALPQTAQAVVNCRILPGHSPEEIRQELSRLIADPQVSIAYIDSDTGEPQPKAPETKAMAPVAPRADVLEPLTRIASTIWPHAPVIPDMETGASDSRFFSDLGIPSYGFSGIALERNDIRAHGRDERIPVVSYNQGVDFFYRFLKALTGFRE